MARTYLPLKGVRVLSFEIAFALPAGTRALSDLGAEVVRIAPPGGNRFGRYVSVTDGVFHGKPCIGIDLKLAAGQKLAWDLAMQADVVCNNFRPSVLDKYGLGHAALRAAKRELITLQISGYGTPGPWSDFPAYGPSTEAAGGLNRLMVDEGEVPIRIGTGVFSDQLAGRHAALAITNALIERDESGVGAHVDVSMTACISHLLGEPLAHAALIGKTPAARGNRDPRFAPQGVYRTLGDDEWLALSVPDDAAWARLADWAAALSDAPAFSDPSLATLVGRQARHDDLDQTLSALFAGRDKNDLATTLQGLGVAATPLRTVQDSVTDPQLVARGALTMVRHSQPLLGYRAHPHNALPWRILGRRRKTLTNYRNTGADNRRVLKGWLGLSRADVRALERAGALHKAPALDIADRVAPDLYDPRFAETADLPS